jgi:glycosyltransferase involved in cell wall biosynthesis
MTQTPLVAVGMPVYNGARWLREAIDSILAQTFDDFELLISDNASTDSTQSICRDYAKSDRRVRYHRNAQNVGLNNNWTLAFKRASAKYFKWASCNDICDPRLLERCVGLLESRPDVVLCYGRTRLMLDEAPGGEPYDDDLTTDQTSACARMRHILERIQLNNAINGVIRAKVLAQSGLIGDYFSSDNVLLAELALHGHIVQLPEELFRRRMTADAATRLKSERERIAYFQPASANPMSFQNWKLVGGYFAAAARAPLPPGEKACVYGHFLKRAFWSRRALGSDIGAAARAALAPRRTP